jgi:hypothetical protein
VTCAKAPLCAKARHKPAALGRDTGSTGEQGDTTMAKAMDMLRKLRFFGRKDTEGPTVFDLRLQKLGGVRHVSVRRAVLFRTGLSH